ncbi:MAG: thiamine diphosphokinase [Rhodobacteraceae bacterium]|nr:thiamine diphosphokinase [Paracoccaceae bacterium]
MNEAIVVSQQNVTLVGGGELGPGDLALALTHAPVLVAADSGADAALAQGYRPGAVIGDFDSLSESARAQLPPASLHHIPEQESTDFDKALRNIQAPLVLAVGFLGARVDHQLSVLNVLGRRAGSPCVLLGADEVIFAAPSQVSLPLDAGDVVSLFPMRPVTGRSTGLTWPIDGLTLAPDGRVGTSNRAEGPVTLNFDGPGMLVILPRRTLAQVIRALARP